MRVIICGAGQVGFQIAKHLAAENNDVVIIDKSKALVDRIGESMDVRAICGYASHPDVLEAAGAPDADMLIAATYSDEVNMVACQVAHTLFQVPRKIARVRRQEYLRPKWRDMFQRDHMPIDVVISPELEVARVVLRRLGAPSAFDSAPFLDGRLRLIGARMPQASPIANTQLRQLSELFPTVQARVLAYVRGGRLTTATGDDQLYAGDDVYFVAEETHVTRMLGLLGQPAESARRVVIVGGGNIGVQVASDLERSGARAKLIEKDPDRALAATELLERTIVHNGDGLDSEILREANVVDAQAVVTLTEDDKVNVLSCALAKTMGCPRAIALANDPSFAPLAGSLGIDAFVNPRATTVSTILRHVRRGRIRALHSIRDGEGETLEAQVLQTSPMAGKALRDLELPSGAVVGAVYSAGHLKFPSGDLVIEAGDVVVMFALRRDLKKIEQMFRVSIEFF